MKYFISILFIFISLHINSQVLNETATKAELQKRGISEQRFKEELTKKGIDLNNIDPNNTQALQSLESQIKSILDELERESKNEKIGSPSINDSEAVIKAKQDALKKSQGSDTNKEVSKEVAKNSAEIKSAIDKGATVEEAISENIQENENDKIPEPVTYGQQLFRDSNLKLFRTTDDSKPSKSYILGPGDVVAVSIFGQSSVNFAKEITKDGYIQPDRLPRFYLTGLTIEKAEQLLKKSLKNYILFGSEEFQIAVTTARTVNVNIFGEVFNNGSFNISAVNTAFNALVAAGGPTNIGSVRNIKLLRPGQSPRTIDVYKFINNPSAAEEFYLQENDYIQVPVANKLITIYGAVNRPYRYELLENENFESLLKYAGGLLPKALKRNIQVTRLESDKSTIIDLNYTDMSRGDFALKNGDVIKVNFQNEDIKNIVTVVGALEDANEEGFTFAFTEGMKVADLIRKTKLRDNAIKETAYLRRYNDDLLSVRYEIINVADALNNPSSASNIVLKKGDMLTVRALSDFKEVREIKVAGAIRKPGNYQLGSSNVLKVSDLLFLSGGTTEKAAAFGYIFRNARGVETTQEYIYIDLASVAGDAKSTANLSLLPNDSLYVYYSDDFVDRSFVRVSGSVRNPASFLFHPSLSVKDALLLAGGLKMEASPNRIDIYRMSFGEEKKTSTIASTINISDDPLLSRAAEYKLQPNDIIVVRNAPEYELQRTVKLEGEVTYPGEYPLTKENTRLSDLIDMAGGTTLESFLSGATLYRSQESLGYVIINLRAALSDKSSFNNLILQEGDVITIPKQNTIVSIIGATNYDEVYPDKLSKSGKINIAYESNKNALYYINNFAGGLDENADRNRITVEHKNGKVEKVKHVLFFKSYPKVKEGSVINVPFKRVKPQSINGDKKEVDWGGVLKDSIIQATSVLSLILLLRSVN